MQLVVAVGRKMENEPPAAKNWKHDRHPGPGAKRLWAWLPVVLPFFCLVDYVSILRLVQLEEQVKWCLLVNPKKQDVHFRAKSSHIAEFAVA